MAGRRIGMALDFSPSGKYAVEWGLKNIARKHDHVIIIVVNKTMDAESGKMQLWEESGSPLIPFSDIANSKVTHSYGIPHDIDILSLIEDEKNIKELSVVFKVYWGDARDKICDAALDIPLDCLVMGSRGLGTLKRALLGSVSNYVVNNCPCPVTVVKLPVSDVGSS